MTATKPIRIKAFWSIYGPRFHYKGRNCDCVSGDTNDWDLAAFDIARWLERHFPDVEDPQPEFYGECAKAAKEAWDAMNRKLQP